jgi:hypothetical protein
MSGIIKFVCILLSAFSIYAGDGIGAILRKQYIV